MAGNLLGNIVGTSTGASGGLTGISGQTPYVAPTQYATVAAAQAAADKVNAAYQQALQPNDANINWGTLSGDLSSGNYADAWKYAASFGNASPLSNVGATSQTESGLANAGSGTLNIGQAIESSDQYGRQNPAIAALESQQGIQDLDPNAKWNAASDTAFYDAAAPYWNSNILGSDPSGGWGGAASLSKDAAANAAAGGAPNVQQYGGIRQTAGGFGGLNAALNKYFPSALELTADVYSAGALSGLNGAVGATVDNAIGTGGSLLGTVAGGATVGATVGAENTLLGGAMGGKITAGSAAENIGLGAVGGGVGAGIASSLGGAGVNSTAAAAAGKIGSGVATNELGSIFQNGINSPGGQIAGNTGMMNNNGGNSVLSLFGTGGLGVANTSGLGGLLGLGAGIAGGIGNSNIASMQNNAYTTAGNAANSGNQWGVNGIGGLGASFNNGTLGINGGAFGPLASQYAGVGSQSLGQAGMYAGGAVPGQVTSGYNSYLNNLGNANGLAGQGQQSGLSLMNSGANLFNSAGTNYNSAYNTSLQSGLSALNPAIQQQSNALLNSNFERGMAGTSGGALQTQALQNSFNTADLQVQQNAVNQGLAAMNTTGNLGLGAFNSGAGQLGNFNNQSASFGQQGFNAGMGYSAFSPQLAGLYQNNANSAVSGASGINTMGIQNAAAGLAAQTNVGNQMNAGAKTQVAGANTYNGGLSSYLASMLGGTSSNLLGTSSVGGAAGGISSLLSSLFGGGSNPGGLSGANSLSGTVSNSELNDVYSGNYSPVLTDQIPSYTADIFGGGY